jgi:UDP-glucose 4-epimerase
MRVLVTGGAGYIGSVSVEALLAAGHEPVVVDDLSTGHQGSVPPGVPFERLSYGDEAAIAEALERHRIDAVLHCAARSIVSESVADPARYYRDNVAGGVALLEAIRRVGVGRLVFSSTAAVYGEPESVPIPEDAPLRPINPYGETKRTFEAAMAWYGAAYGLRGVSLRYFNAAGASERNGEVHDPETHLIPRVLAAAAGGPPVTLFGDDYETPDGTPIRDYIHVEDLARAHVLALETDLGPADGGAADSGSADGGSSALRVFNLGSGRGASVREVLAAAERVVGHPIPHAIGPRRVGDPPVLVASSSRARELLGWEPMHDEPEGIVASDWAWRRRHPRGYVG